MGFVLRLGLDRTSGEKGLGNFGMSDGLMGYNVNSPIGPNRLLREFFGQSGGPREIGSNGCGLSSNSAYGQIKNGSLASFINIVVSSNI